MLSLSDSVRSPLQVRTATPEEWDRAWQRSSTATFFESRQFAELWSAYTRGASRPTPVLISLGKDWSVVVPLSRQTAVRGLGAVYLLAPAGTYGGWMKLRGRVDVQEAHLMVDWLLSHCPSLTWRANPSDSVALAAFPAKGRIDFTQSVFLESGMEAVLAGWSESHLRSLHKAEKLGVAVRRAETLSDWRSFYRLCEQSVERWSRVTSRRQRRLFALLAELDHRFVTLWIASRQGQDLAGVICLASKNSVVCWREAASPEAFSDRAIHAVYHRAMTEACESGSTWFDMYPSAGLSSVEHFKRGFGGLPLLSPTWRSRGGLPQWSTVVKARAHQITPSTHG